MNRNGPPNFLSILSIFIIKFSDAIHRTLRHYETLHKDEIKHTLVKRGLKPSNHPYNTIKEVEFKVLGKDFRVILHPHKEVLHSNFKAYSVDRDGNETIFHMSKLWDPAGFQIFTVTFCH